MKCQRERLMGSRCGKNSLEFSFGTGVTPSFYRYILIGTFGDGVLSRFLCTKIDLKL